VEDLVKGAPARDRKATGVVLTGGEPTLYKADPVVVKAARRSAIATCSSDQRPRALEPRLLGALVEAGLTEVSPSLHGSNAETHDALTLAPGASSSRSRA